MAKNSSCKSRLNLSSLALLVLAFTVLMSYSSADPVGAAPLGTRIWYANFASGTNYPYFNPATDGLPYRDTCNGVITVVQNSQRAGYVGSYGVQVVPSGTDSCREYPVKSWHPALALTDFYVELWVYVPSLIIKDWISFATVAFDNGAVITVNMWTQDTSRPGQALYVHTESLFTKSDVNQWNAGTGSTVLVPFNKWFKVGLEVHFKAPNQASAVIVYQNDVMVIKWSPIAVSKTFPSISAVHFGLYAGAQQGSFSMYNSDITLYSLRKS